MNKKTYLNFLKGFILLSPIPFGCVGEIYSPLFYLSLLVLTFFGISSKDHKKLSGRGSVFFAFQGKIRLLVIILFGFIIFQIIPLPSFLVKIISPVTTETAGIFKEHLPEFYPISNAPVETILFGLRLLVVILFLWNFVRINFRRKELVSIIHFLILSVTVQSIFGLIKYTTGSDNFFLFFHEVTEDPTRGFLTGTLGNPNHFAFYLEMVFPLLLSLFFLKIKLFDSGGNLREKFISTVNADRKVLITFALFPFLGLIIILTGARSGILTLLISFVIFSMLTIYLRRSRAIRKKLKIIFLTLALVTIFMGIKNTTDKFMKKDYFSSGGRFLRWPNTIDMFKDHPLFGTGFGTYKYSFYLYDSDPTGAWSTNAHNEYLEFLSESGLIGSMIFLLLVGYLVYSISKMWRARRHPEIKILGIGILTSIFAALFHSFFDFSLRIPSNSFVFILIMGLGIQFATYKKEFTEDGRKLRSKRDPAPDSPGGGVQ